MQKKTANPSAISDEYRAEHSGTFAQIPNKLMQVKTKASCEGGGTGQEFTRNLLIPGDGPGNKWYDPYSHGTWIQLSLKSPRVVSMFGLKSANDCPERDPSHFSFYGVTDNGEKILLSSAYSVEFEERYLWKLFSTNNTQAFKTYFLDITANLNVAKQDNWGSGTQLAEISLYEQSVTFKED